LILEVAFLAVSLMVWFIRRRDESESFGLAGGPAEPRVREADRHQRKGPVVDERLRDVPVPWGWPNCRHYRDRRPRRTLSETMYGFVDVLFTEKQLVSDVASDPKVIGSIRALLEDRHHPVRRKVESEPEAKPDPDKDIWFVGPVAESREAANLKFREDLHQVRELRAPWGW
jgi:hypothetical protein